MVETLEPVSSSMSSGLPFTLTVTMIGGFLLTDAPLTCDMYATSSSSTATALVMRGGGLLRLEDLVVFLRQTDCRWPLIPQL